MISCSEIHNLYNDLYKEIRKYFWTMPAVEALADLEVACYKACPDLVEVKNCVNNLKLYARDVILDDEDLKDAFDAFDEINVDDTVYVKLDKVNEVVQ